MHTAQAQPGEEGTNLKTPTSNDLPHDFVVSAQIYGWLPEPYESVSELPRGGEDDEGNPKESMPQHLIKYIEEHQNDDMVLITRAIKQSMKTQCDRLLVLSQMGSMVWVACEGENPADRENIGEMEYFPYPGIPTYHFPYMNEGKPGPVLFAHFKGPKREINL